MAWDRRLSMLRDVLADLYFAAKDARRVSQDAGLDPKFIDFNGPALSFWHAILNEARKRDKVSAIVDVAYGEYPENPILKLASEGKLTGTQGPAIGDALAWRGDVEADNLEKLIGERSALLPVSFLEKGLQRSRSVVRVVRADGSTGSGFLIADNLLITNNHVLPNRNEAGLATVQFNYQLTVEGLDAAVEEAELDPGDLFLTSVDDDWTAVRVRGEPNNRWGALPLMSTEIQKGDWVNIVQHPGGGHKQIALYNNTVAYADDRRVQYLTDTLPGSSGSPVFDSAWQVVALHHSGGWLREPGANRRFYRNEGIHIGVIIAALAAERIDEP